MGAATEESFGWQPKRTGWQPVLPNQDNVGRMKEESFDGHRPPLQKLQATHLPLQRYRFL
jgi:hypothetical protein